MENLKKLFPNVPVTFTTDPTKGISSSEATRIKNSNHNKAEEILAEYSGIELYKISRNIISAENTRTEEKEPLKILKPEEFDALDDVAKLYAVSAKYGSAVQYKSDLIENLIDRLESDRVAKAFDIELNLKEIPAMRQKKYAFMYSHHARTIDDYCNFDKAEKLRDHASQELVELIQDELIKALEQEARAAVYGKHGIHKGAFMHTLMQAKDVIKMPSRDLQHFAIDQEKLLAYDKEEWREKFEEAEAKHTKHQQERNACFKKIKTAARDLQIKFDEEYRVFEDSRDDIIEENDKLRKQYDREIAAARNKLKKEAEALLIRK